MSHNIILNKNIISNHHLINIVQQRFITSNRRNYFLSSNHLHKRYSLKHGNLLNTNKDYNLNISKGILLRKYTSETSKKDDPVNRIAETNKIEEPNAADNNNKSNKESEKRNKRSKKPKSDFSKITLTLLGGIGIGYGLNQYLNKSNEDNTIFGQLSSHSVPEVKREDNIVNLPEPIKKELNIDGNKFGENSKNDVTVDIKIKEKTPDDKISVTKINYDSKKDPNKFTTTTSKTKATVEVKTDNTSSNDSSSGTNPITRGLNYTYNYIGSLFGFINKEEEESMSEFDKEIEEAYADIINNISKSSPSEIKIKNLKNNESIEINAESINDEKSLKEIEEKFKSWGTENAKEMKKNKSEEKNSSMVISNNVDQKEDNNKIVDFVNDMVQVTNDAETNKKIIKVSTKPIAKAFQEASKLSSTIEKNKDNLPEFLTDCIKDTTNVIMKLSNDNVDIQNTFLDTVKIFSDSMNVISDYLDQLEIEIKTELNDDNNNDKNNTNSTKF